MKSNFSIDNINLKFQIKFKNKKLLSLIKEYLGGYINYNENEDLYYYETNTFGSAKKIINYFDHYHLLSSKHIYYLKWRKTYVIIQDNNHLTINGFNRILKFIKFMDKN
uniref:LAGLIDADG homing endonuclease n=1 Tax=Fuscoporia gilva TaxID=40471 RepID=UPI0023D7BBF7|nr:LAGLIDADG homing endonuclease [Fuscoporia gilva]WDD39628.1 LAGLIDADG homing endonuclease [Fuscoporia gilva]